MALPQTRPVWHCEWTLLAALHLPIDPERHQWRSTCFFCASAQDDITYHANDDTDFNGPKTLYIYMSLATNRKEIKQLIVRRRRRVAFRCQGIVVVVIGAAATTTTAG